MESTKLKLPNKSNHKKTNTRHYSTPHKASKGYKRSMESNHSHYHRKHSSRERSRSKEGGRSCSRAYSLPKDNGRHVVE
jgi:hypothetical protein